MNDLDPKLEVLLEQIRDALYQQNEELGGISSSFVSIDDVGEKIVLLSEKLDLLNESMAILVKEIRKSKK